MIGMNATVLNGAKIGKNCIIGANALVAEGKQIPDNSLVVGVPGKILREVTEQDRAMIQLGVKHYHHNAKAFRENLKGMP